jgi:transposase
MARVKGSAELLEDRRRQALRLLSEGRSLREVAGVINCAASSVLRWQQAWKRGGEQALRVRSSPGRPRKLKTGQRRQLLRLLRKGARTNGYSTDPWTTARIAEVIKRHFGVKYHRDHVGRLMRSLGWVHFERHAEVSGPAERNEPVERIGRLRHTPKTLQGWIPASTSDESRSRSF